MSLINKMLQDMETRRTTQSETANKKSVYEGLKPVKISGTRAPSRRLTILLALIVVVAAGAYAWIQWGETWLASLTSTEVAVKPPAVTVRKPAAKPAAAPASVPAPAPAGQTTVAAAPAPVAQQAPPPMEAAAPKIEAKTAAAPPPATVKSKSTAVVEPDYWTVAKGETLYGISAKTGIDLWNLSNWNRLGQHHIIHVGQRLRLTPPASTEAKPRAKPATTQQREKKKAVPKKIVTAAAEKPGSEDMALKAGHPMDSGMMDKKVRPLSSDDKAETEYRQAVNLLQKGRASDAEKHLKSALEISAEHTGARELLSGLALQRGHWREAEQILEQGVEKVPAYYPFAQLLARVYVEHGADQKALTAMEASRQAGAGNADYMGFLAALYQRAGKHQEAITTYTEAIKLASAEGRSWLGMGISLEAIQNWNAAGEAYQRAIDTGALDDNLLNYARQRLTVVKKK
ncbi:MAG: LysM peptidoglycan-binding domain-containing protein [Sulfuricaulis sp.]|nr:LysM peptidoglycan-binding domain-containing protein [Sulfuricaulis sp.]